MILCGAVVKRKEKQNEKPVLGDLCTIKETMHRESLPSGKVSQ